MNMSKTLTKPSKSLALALLVSACSPAAPPPPPIVTPHPTKPEAAAAPAPQPESRKMGYPESRAEAVVEQLYGVSVEDPYRWLEDAKADEVRKWMASQDAFARQRLHALPGRDALASRLRELFYVESVTAPHHRGKRYFYTRTHPDKEKAIVYWREGENAEKVLLDPNTMSADGTVSLGVWVPSWDGKKVAYALRANNSDEATLHLMEVATGKVSDTDTIDGAKYAQPSWTPSGDGFYYTWLPSDPSIAVAERPGYAEVRFHSLGSDPKQDPVIHEKTGDAETFIGADLSRDGHWLFLYIQHGWNSTDVYFRDERKHEKDWRKLAVGLPAQFSVEAWRDRFYVHTNDGAPRWRIYKVDPSRAERDKWKEIIPEDKEAVLDGFSIVGGELALVYSRNAASALEVRTLDGKKVRDVQLPGIGAASHFVGNPDEDAAWFAFASFTQPLEIYQTSVKTGKTSLWAEVKLPIDPTPYTVDQVWYPSRDGTKVSMFIVHRKDMPLDGSTPFILTGYGGFNVSMKPSFYGSLYPWLEAGGGFALPNLRGGGEYGEDWHKAGKGEHKQNVFDDFIAAAEYLIHNRYTTAEKLAIRGGSNGGLLVGAAMTQRPDLFRVVICQVPLLDMIRFHKFGSGKTWVPEYGSAEDEKEFKTLYAYSPYHHVSAQAYPAVLMMSADADDRVDPMHARKMVALLQARSTSERPIWLRIEQHAGHGGADLVKQAVDSGADSLAFIMSQLGMAPRAR